MLNFLSLAKLNRRLTCTDRSRVPVIRRLPDTGRGLKWIVPIEAAGFYPRFYGTLFLIQTAAAFPEVTWTCHCQHRNTHINAIDVLHHQTTKVSIIHIMHRKYNTLNLGKILQALLAQKSHRLTHSIDAGRRSVSIADTIQHYNTILTDFQQTLHY